MGPLKGIKIVEMAGIGPGPFCCMLFADLGAEVVRLDRIEPVDTGVKQDPRFDLLNRGRRSVALDLKKASAVAVAKRLIGQADMIVEGFRPGVMERIGLGPEACLAINPRLVFGRITGWGQNGPMSQAAGHDINYIALSGALHSIGRSGEAPIPPINLVGDFGGGALYLAFGMLAALLEARKSGKGQVVDAAMVEGAASLMTLMYGFKAAGLWSDQRGSNFLDGGAPWYDVYKTKDDKYVAVGPVEGRFYALMLRQLGLDPATLPDQYDRAGWPVLRSRFQEAFAGKSREEWCSIMEGGDACFAPVLTMEEAAHHPHNIARGSFVEVAGILQPGPAPRFSRTNPAKPNPPPSAGAHTDVALLDWGFTPQEIEQLRGEQAIA